MVDLLVFNIVSLKQFLLRPTDSSELFLASDIWITGVWKWFWEIRLSRNIVFQNIGWLFI